MSVIKKTMAALFALGMLGVMQVAEARCYVPSSFKTIEIPMNLGRVVISPNAQIGDIIASRTYTMPESGTSYKCTWPTKITFKAELINPGTMVSEHVYATNIPGVGMRLSREGAVKITYPGEYRSSAASNWYLAGSTFTIELIKTSAVTGSGVLTPRQYSAYKTPEGKTLISTYISGNGITIVSPSCVITSNRELQVDMATESLSRFTGVGSKVGNSNFSIDLKCSGGVSVSGYANVNTSFSGKAPNGVDRSKGILINEYEGGAAAKGIGFILESKGTPVAFDKSYLVGRLSDNQESNFSFPLSTSYYQYGNEVSSGHVLSHVTYNITYD